MKMNIAIEMAVRKCQYASAVRTIRFRLALKWSRLGRGR